MKRIIRQTGYALLMLLLLPLLGGCGTEDDLELIFNNKIWKLTRLTTEKGKGQFYDGLWNTTEARENSLKQFYQSGNYTLRFNCSEISGIATGTIAATSIPNQCSINDAALSIDGKSRSISIKGKVSGTSNDPLAKAFCNGLLKVFKYEGDTRSLTLYFEDGNTIKVMGFIAQ